MAVELIQKGDVVWAPYRKDPHWPSKVTAVYPKKVSYIFYPLPSEMKRGQVFSAKHSEIFALGVNDVLASNARKDLRQAWAQAALDVKRMGRQVGSMAPRFKSLKQIDLDEVDYDAIRVIAGFTDNHVDVKEEKLDDAKSTGSADLFDEEDEEKATKKSKSDGKDKKTGTKRVAVSESNGKTNGVKKGKHIDENKAINNQKNGNDEGQQIPSISSEEGQLEAKKRGAPPTNTKENVFDFAVKNYKKIVDQLVKKVPKMPARNGLEMRIQTMDLITDDQTDELFHMIMTYYLSIRKDTSTLEAVHFVITHLLVGVLKEAAVKTGGMSGEEVDELFSKKLADKSNGDEKQTEKRQRMSHPLEDLVRVACQELDKINGTA